MRVQRVQSDMHLDYSNKFNPDKFNVIYNAVVLAKLTLLGADELNRLIDISGVRSFSVYAGNTLYYDESPFNILYNAIGSIDGNFAWMGIAPYFPRDSNHDDTSSDEDRTFGYLANNGIDGFKIWVEPEVRDKVFKKIFKGPIAPGIEFPSDVAQSELLPNYYTERVCAGNPFPVDTSHQRCGATAGWLLPILTLILH